jgi:hypothetical protein
LRGKDKRWNRQKKFKRKNVGMNEREGSLYTSMRRKKEREKSGKETGMNGLEGR